MSLNNTKVLSLIESSFNTAIDQLIAGESGAGCVNVCSVILVFIVCLLGGTVVQWVALSTHS